MSRYLIVDSFTSRPFRGNPAAVVLLEERRDDEWMRHVAREMNLSETAFLLREGEGFNLRWFTPAVEIDLCGHATLASAHALWQESLVPSDRAISFSTLSGILTARPRGGAIELDFPTLPPTSVEAPTGMLAALGLVEAPVYIGVNASRFFVVRVRDERVVRELSPDFAALAAVDARAVIVTASGSSTDIVSRFFCPRLGMNEDPVTGAAHCTLGPYWKQELGRSDLTAFQASVRGGFVNVRVEGERTFLSGQSVTVARGQLLA